jgi:hypothetical protein
MGGSGVLVSEGMMVGVNESAGRMKGVNVKDESDNVGGKGVSVGSSGIKIGV